MSWDVQCHLLAAGERTEIPLVGLSDDSWRVVYRDPARRSPRTWQDAAREYLAIIAERYAPKARAPASRKQRVGRDEHADRFDAEDARSFVKRERRKIGLAWREAEERGGCLVFEVV